MAHSAGISRLSIVAIASLLAALAGCASNKPKVAPPRWATLPPKQVPAYLKDTLFELVDVANTEPLIVNNWGLVVNLPGATGSSDAPIQIKEYIIKQMEKGGFGTSRGTTLASRMTPDEVLRDPKNAIVRVDGAIPAGARRGQGFDVAVSALDNSAIPNNTTSLLGGILYTTDLFIGGTGPAAPGTLIDIHGTGHGPILVNPEYALSGGNDSVAKQSLRFGVIPGGGVVQKDRAILLRLRAPSYKGTHAVEFLIDTHFQDTTVAAAFDDAIVQTYVPRSFNGDWEHFVGVVTHLYFAGGRAEFAATKAKELVAEAQQPGALLMDISYCWEGLGTYALPYIIPLMSDRRADVAFAAARAAAFLGDSSAQAILADMARTPGHPFEVTAVQTLGALPNSPAISQILRQLLDSPDTTVRVEAYRVLAQRSDPAIYSRNIGGKFVLDIVPSRSTPMIYATRRGASRLAIFGPTPSIALPAAFSAIDNRLTITSERGERAVKVFYRDPLVARPVAILSRPDIAEIVARLGGEGPDDAPQKLNLSYGEIVSILQAMTQQQQVVAMMGAAQIPTPLVLQSSPRAQSEIEAAPAIPEQTRPQGDTTGERAAGEIPDNATVRREARK